MYASEVDGKKLTFFVSGKLWGRSLVMGDQETGSEWSHILGRAQAGPLTGKELTIIPSSMTNWESWRAANPQTTVTMMGRSAHSFQTEMLQRAQAFGVGLAHQGQARIWRFDLLKEQPLVNDQLEDLSLLVHFDTSSSSPLVWDRQFRDQTLKFEINGGNVQDIQSGSTWNMQTGIATTGKMKGSQLTPVPAIVTFCSAWKRFHPNSSVWLPARQQGSESKNRQ